MSEVTTAAGELSTISARDAIKKAEAQGASVVLDVRTEVEVAAEHVAGSLCIPLDQLERRIEDVRTMHGSPLLLCRSGKRASQAAEVLERLGMPGAVVIEGGILAWAEAGGTTVKGSGVMSLERQVRIAAGGLVATGAALGFFVHPGFHGLSAFVGCGLVFAGVTDTCGMGMMIARMPWNRRG